MSKELAIVAPFGLDRVKETRAASELLLLKPTSFLGRFQSGSAKRVIREIETAVGAEKAAEEVVDLPVETVSTTVKRDDEDATSATKAAGRVKADTAVTFTTKSINAEEKAKFLLRQATLARYLRTEGDFTHLSLVTDSEKAELLEFRKQRRAAVMLPRKERTSAMSEIISDYSLFRKRVIDRLAADPVATDETIKQS